MATYLGEDMMGSGEVMEMISASSLKLFEFRVWEWLSGSAYFTMETIPNSYGDYGGIIGRVEGMYNFIGISEINPKTLITSSYIASMEILSADPGTQYFHFSPTSNIPKRSVMLRVSGGVKSLTIT